MDSMKVDRLGPGDAISSSRTGYTSALTGNIAATRGLPVALSKTSIGARPLNSGITSKYAPRSSSSPSYVSVASSHASHTSADSSAQSLRTPLLSRLSTYPFSRRPPSKLPHQAFFNNLPPEVTDCILRQLRLSHESPSSGCCHTCHLRDLCSLSLTSRAWDKVVRKRLYERIHIVGYDSSKRMKKYKITTGVRLIFLRRTLRERNFLAQHVRKLSISPPLDDSDPVSKDMINTAASLVMACPNLERFVGFYPTYCHEFNRLTHSLSTRRKLKEHVWVIGANAAVTQRSYKQLVPGLMDPEQKASFVFFHDAWSSLTTLFIHSPNQGILEKDTLVNLTKSGNPREFQGLGALHRLPALKHLCISMLDSDDFDDLALQQLPALQSLRLQDLEGITFWGLSEYSRTETALALKNLSLVNLDIAYISAISNLLLHLKYLKRFTLVQDTSPEVADEELIFQPIIASHQLEFLHWDIAVPGSANVNLANSIRAQGFPQLRTIRAPSDYDGLLQALCKPRVQIETPSDQAKEICGDHPAVNSLRHARRAAQHRIEKAWGTVQFTIIVEESNIVHEMYDLNGFVGTVGSKIYYSLEPDVPRSDTALIDFPDISEREQVVAESTCDGSWNSAHTGGSKWWQHTERPRCQSTDLQTFF